VPRRHGEDNGEEEQKERGERARCGGHWSWNGEWE
jgi:hypothetical protein